jgi:magnesium-transporting ATPase (P-type)
MVGEGISDYTRWKEDRKTNALVYKKLKSIKTNEYVAVRSYELKVGDIIELHDD